MLTEEDTKRGRLLQQYVTARITRLDRINIGLFEYDWYNTLYFFALNADEQIYLRYGGRDVQSATTYLNLESLELALEQGLRLHRLYRAGRLPKKSVPAARYPHEIPALYELTSKRGRCVECHLVGDMLNVQRETDGTLDKLRHLYRTPELSTLGIRLDIPRGLAVAEATGGAAEAGLLAGDVIRALEGSDVWTFGDLQWQFGHVPHAASRVDLTVERAGKLLTLPFALPDRWWYSDLTYRNLSVDPRIYFRAEPLTRKEKSAHGFIADGFASRVRFIDPLAELLASHELRVGDIVYDVDGQTRDPVATTADTFIKLRKRAGDEVTLQVLRGSDRLAMPLKTQRMGFRK